MKEGPLRDAWSLLSLLSAFVGAGVMIWVIVYAFTHEGHAPPFTGWPARLVLAAVVIRLIDLWNRRRNMN